MEEQVNVTPGVESVPAAGEQDTGSDSFDLESLLFGDSSDTGVEDKTDAADPAEGTEQGEGQEGQELPDDASKAFAKKWAAESEKLEEKIRSKVVAELEQRTKTTQQEQKQGAPEYRALSEAELQKLADDLNVNEQTAKILYDQQQMINRLHDGNIKRDQRDREASAYNDAVQYARQLRTENSSMPEWDDKMVQEYRMKHYSTYGTTLPWKEAYKMQLADAALTGNLTRQAQQEAIRKIQERDTASVNLKTPSTQKMTINDLTKEQFEKMVEDAKMGRFKKS